MIYSVFGLALDSSRPLPGLNPDSSRNPRTADIRVYWGEHPATPTRPNLSSAPPFFTSNMITPDGGPVLRVWRINDGDFLFVCYTDGTEFWVDRGGGNVWANWSGSSTFEDAVSYFLGPILGLLLRFGGITCLHASALNVLGSAVLFAGEEGAGKSTTAAAMVRRGHAVLSDDISALEECGNEIVVRPSFPCLSLWSDSVSMLYGPDKNLPEYSPNFDKRRLDLESEKLPFQASPLQLGAVFLLGERSSDPDAPFMETVDARESLFSLIVHSYANSLIDPEMRAREFVLLGRLLSSVTVRRVRASSRPEKLDAMCQKIETECQLIGTHEAAPRK